MDRPSKEERTLWRRQKENIPYLLYQVQKKSSNTRGHAQPSYTKEWLYAYMMSNVEYHRLYDIWVLSGYDKDYKPTIDRIEDSIGYTEYNISICDWRTNRARGHKARQLGDKTTPQGKVCKTIKQYKGVILVKEYVSISQASRETGISRGNIQACFKGLRPKAGGYKWKI